MTISPASGITYREWQRHRMCDRKYAYPSETVAMNAAIANSWRTGNKMTWYRCPFCGDCHVTKVTNQ